MVNNMRQARQGNADEDAYSASTSEYTLVGLQINLRHPEDRPQPALLAPKFVCTFSPWSFTVFSSTSRTALNNSSDAYTTHTTAQIVLQHGTTNSHDGEPLHQRHPTSRGQCASLHATAPRRASTSPSDVHNCSAAPRPNG